MTIRNVISEIESANHPVAKVLYKGEYFKVITIGFKKSMLLKEHKTALPAKLTVLKGKVIYREGEVATFLSQYEEKIIQPEVLHSVEAEEDSLCLLIQGK